MPALSNDEVEEWLASVAARSIPIARAGVTMAVEWCETYLSTATREETVALIRQVELELPVMRESLPPGTTMVPASSGDATRVFYVRGRPGAKRSPGQLTLAQSAMALACRSAGSPDGSLGLPAEASVRSGAGGRIYLLPELQVRVSRAIAMPGSSWPYDPGAKARSKV